jgi:hypothetical protein
MTVKMTGAAAVASSVWFGEETSVIAVVSMMADRVVLRRV